MKAKFAIERADNGYLICDDSYQVMVSSDENMVDTIGKEITALITETLKENPELTRVDMSIELELKKSQIEL